MMLMFEDVVILASQRQDKSNATDESNAMYYRPEDIFLPILIEKGTSKNVKSL